MSYHVVFALIDDRFTKPSGYQGVSSTPYSIDTAYGIAKNRPLPPYLFTVTLHLLSWLITGNPILKATLSAAWRLSGKTSTADPTDQNP